jgi:hypothetical protein
MKPILVASLLLAACGGTTTPAQQRPLTAESMRGPAAGPAGRVLVITATCGSLETECRNTWAPTVDQIVLGGLEFRGYDTIDPQTLRKDERKRDERIEEHDSKQIHEHSAKAGGVGFIGILPIGGAGGSQGSSVSISSSRHRTIVLQGANYEDLRLEDKQALMQLAGAGTVATTRVVVGANHGTWSVAQNVEVVVKLAAADTGVMRWASRCMASSVDYPNIEAAIENAARCAASAFPLNQ